MVVEGSLGNWARFISLNIPSLSFECGELPPISSSIQGTLRGLSSTTTSLGTLQEFQVFFTFLEQKMPPESWALQLRQRKRRLKVLLFFNRTRKSTLLLRPGTVASADRARSLIILQTPTKNVQELAKEEGEKRRPLGGERSWEFTFSDEESFLPGT